MKWTLIILIQTIAVQMAQAQVTLGYSLRSNLADDQTQRTTRHLVDLGAGYSLGEVLNGKMSVGAGIGYSYVAAGTAIQKEQPTDALSDFSIYGSYVTSMSRSNRLTISLSDDVPTSRVSIDEGYKSIIGLSTGLDTSILKQRLILSNSLGTNYIVNSFAESPTTLESNPRWISRYSLSLRYTVLKSLSFTLATAARLSQFVNGESFMGNTTSLSASYGYKAASFFGSVVIGQYDKNDAIKFLYLDQTSRWVSLGVSIEI